MKSLKSLIRLFIIPFHPFLAFLSAEPTILIVENVKVKGTKVVVNNTTTFVNANTC